MTHGLTVLIVAGSVLFCIGGFARTYMNFVIGRRAGPRGRGIRSTEIRYMRLVREQGAPAWPLLIAATCIPIGIAMVFFAVIRSGQIRAH